MFIIHFDSLPCRLSLLQLEGRIATFIPVLKSSFACLPVTRFVIIYRSSAKIIRIFNLRPNPNSRMGAARR